MAYGWLSFCILLASLLGFELIAKIPMIDSTIVYNRAKRGVPLVMDKTKNTIEARKELFVISDAIYPVNVFADLREEMEIYKNCRRNTRFHILRN